MKGAYSSPESIVGEWAFRSLFPDTPYRFDSGGDPRFLPSLTFESAREFHARYYHPSNCRIFLYGDIPAVDILRFLDERYLGGFSASKIEASIPLQPRWSSPRRLEKTFPVKPGTPLDKRSSITLSWLLPAAADPEGIVAHEVLSEVLIGSAGSPLRKKLIDSGLGEDLSPASGLETDLKELVFTVGLRGSEADREEKVSGAVLETLSTLARQGLDRLLVQSMINRVEFRHREIRGNGSPYALRLMGRAFRGWVHGLDPLSSLEFAPAMNGLKSRIAADPRCLEKIIEGSLVSNLHRVTLVVRPDREQEQKDAAEEKALLARVVGALSPVEKEKVLREAKDFRLYQLAPDAPETLALLPSLTRSDLPREVERIPSLETATPRGIPVSLHDLFTNEIAYIDLCFPTDAIGGERTLLLPLFGRAVCGCGLPGTPYDKVALDLFRLTGGFSASLDAGGIVGKTGSFGQYVFFRTRCLRQNLREAAALVSSLLSSADFRDFARLRELVLELRNGMKASLVPSGHQFAMLRAASVLSPSAAREEQWRGVTQLLFLEGLVKDLDRRLPWISESLESIRRDLLVRGTLIANATAGAGAFPEVMDAVDVLAGPLPARRARTGATGRPRPTIALPSARNLSFRAPRSGTWRGQFPASATSIRRTGPRPFSGIFSRRATSGRRSAWRAGPTARSPSRGTWTGCSSSVPTGTRTSLRTLRTFREGLAYMEKGTLDESEVEKAVIGTVGREDRPLDPGEKGFVSLQRRLHGITDEGRQARRDRLIATRRSELSRAARKLSEAFDQGFTSVIANRASLAEAATAVPELAGRAIDLPE